nr:unnamed protein product [Callosobruchus chinensis]CAH7762993.1 unnamed protein product [Callosobruchus chinensis]
MILTIHRHVISKVPRYSVTNENEKTWVLHVTGVQQEDKGVLHVSSKHQPND